MVLRPVWLPGLMPGIDSMHAVSRENIENL